MPKPLISNLFIAGGKKKKKNEEDTMKYSDLGGLNFNPKKMKGTKRGKKQGK